jgi:hypothetical protein
VSNPTVPDHMAAMNIGELIEHAIALERKLDEKSKELEQAFKVSDLQLAQLFARAEAAESRLDSIAEVMDPSRGDFFEQIGEIRAILGPAVERQSPISAICQYEGHKPEQRADGRYCGGCGVKL